VKILYALTAVPDIAWEIVALRNVEAIDVNCQSITSRS